MTDSNEMQNQDGNTPTSWTLEVWEDPSGRSPFEKWYNKLDDHDQAVVETALVKILERYGQDIVATEWGKALGGGLYEFRIRKKLSTLLNWDNPSGPKEMPPWADRSVLLRIFCTFHGDKVVLLFQGYNKGKDPSERRQTQEIKKARKYLRQWKRGI